MIFCIRVSVYTFREERLSMTVFFFIGALSFLKNHGLVPTYVRNDAYELRNVVDDDLVVLFITYEEINASCVVLEAK